MCLILGESVHLMQRNIILITMKRNLHNTVPQKYILILLNVFARRKHSCYLDYTVAVVCGNTSRQSSWMELNKPRYCIPGDQKFKMFWSTHKLLENFKIELIVYINSRLNIIQKYFYSIKLQTLPSNLGCMCKISNKAPLERLYLIKTLIVSRFFSCQFSQTVVWFYKSICTFLVVVCPHLQQHLFICILLVKLKSCISITWWSIYIFIEAF